MIDLLVASIISAADIENIRSANFNTELSRWENYINYQLEEKYSNTNQTVTFDATIPVEFHEAIRKACKNKWSVTIQEIIAFNAYEKCYKFIFTRKPKINIIEEEAKESQ